uniref:Small EDRK-rich factor-like N-terminal domain-containing protein n=1 Tax=Oryza nivara TaxID=4536 RepID=A0A0E0J1C3_ORYNI
LVFVLACGDPFFFLCFFLDFSPAAAWGARGNQRDRDRERAQARKPNAKGPQDGLTPEQRRERDKKALEEKAAKKAAQAAGGGTSTDNKNKAGGAKKLNYLFVDLFDVNV